MHTIALVVALVMTACIVGVVARCRRLLIAWLLASVAFVPYIILYAAFRSGGSEQLFLVPVMVVATVLLGKSVIRLLGMVAATPRAVVNVPATAPEPHWAASA